MTEVAEKDTIKVRLVRNPLDPTSFVEEELVYNGGYSLLDYMDGIENPNAWTIGYNGLAIGHTLWNDFAPKPGEVISLVRAPEGGDGGKQILRLVLVVALAVAAPYLAGLAGLGAIGTAVLTAAIVVTGTLLINALIPPPKLDLPSSDFDAQESPSYGIDGPKNTSREGLPVPVVYGTHRVGGNIVDIHTVNANDKQYLYMRTALNDGEVQSISDIEINDQPIGNFTEVQTRTRLGQETQLTNDWFDDAVRLVNRGVKLDTGWITHTTTSDVDRLRLDFVAPQGLVEFNDRGDKVQKTVQFEIQFKPTSSSTWSALRIQNSPYYSSIPQFGGNFAGRLLTRVHVNAAETAALNGLYYNQTSGIEYRLVGAPTWTPVTGQTTQAQGRQYPTWGNSAGLGSIVAPGGIHTYDLDLPAGDYEVQTTSGTLIETQTFFEQGTTVYTMNGNSTKAQRKTLESVTLPRDTYDIRVRRSSVESTSTQVIDTVYLSDVGEIDNSPVQMNGVASTSIRVRISDQINSRPTVTSLVQGCLLQEYDRDGNPTVLQWSANPAWIALDILTNPLRGAAMDLSRFDFDMWVEWAEYCTANNLEFNAAFDYETNVWDAAQLVLRIGHAQLIRLGTKLSIAIDRADTPVMIFNDSNIVKDSVQTTWLPMAERATEIQLSYADKTDGYKRKTIRLVDDTVSVNGERTRVSTYTELGITDHDQAAAEAEYQLRRNKLLQKSVTLEAPLEAIALTLGDVCELHTSAGDFAGGETGKTEAGSTTTTIQLDRDIVIQSGQSYSLLLYQDAVKLYDASIGNISGNTIRIDGVNAFANYDNAERLVQGGVDVQITRYYENGGSLYVIVDDNSGLSTAACEIWDTNIVEERAITTGVGTHNSVTVSAAFSKAPGQYQSWVFGQVANIRQPYRLIGMDYEDLHTRKLIFIEYNDAIYLPPGVAIPAPEIVGPSLPEQVLDLSVDYRKFPTGAQEVQDLVVAWNRPDPLVYGGADVYLDDGTGEYQLYDTVLDVTQCILTVKDTNNIRIRVVGFDKFGRRAPFTVAPSLDFTANFEFRTLDDVTGVAASDLNYDTSGRVQLSWTAPANDIVTGYTVETRVLLQSEYDAIIADPTLGEPQPGWTQTQIDDWNNAFGNSVITPTTSALVPNLKAGYYQFRVKALLGLSSSDWAVITYELQAPAFLNAITGLQTVDGGSIFNGKDCAVIWDDIFANAIAEGKTDLPYILQDYQVEVLSAADALLRTETVYEPKYTYTYDKNNEDTVGSRARRTFKIRVTARGRQGQTSANQVITFNNPEPSAAGAPVIDGVDVTLPVSNDADFLGYRIWVKDTDDINTGSDTSFVISQNSFVVPANEGQTRYFIYAPIDEFDDGSLNESTSYSITAPTYGTNDYTQLVNAPVDVGSALPSPTSYTGPELFYNTTDGKLYRYSGGAWTAAVAAGDITGNIPVGQIPSLPASQITSGQFGSARLADGSVIAAKILSGAVTTDKLNAGAVTAAKIAANTITASQIAANTITAGQILAGTITASELAANSVTATQILAGAITAVKINVSSLSAISANLGTVTAGSLSINNRFIVDSSGNVTIRNATTGQRLQISNSVLQVYDSSNTLRVRLGIW
ncbi:MAG: phage tail protein [Hyphomonas sp.]|nr:phage tail protein [Hyphomonas sp.]